MNERYQTSVEYRLHLLLHKSQKHVANVELEMQKMYEKCAVQMKDQTSSWQGLFPFVDVLTEFKRACNSMKIYEGSTIWIYRVLMCGHIHAAIKARLTLS